MNPWLFTIHPVNLGYMLGRVWIQWVFFTAGSFDLDAELKIWISGNALPLQKQFNKNLNIYELQTVLAEYVLK